jgi:hypothetical protein
VLRAAATGVGAMEGANAWSRMSTGPRPGTDMGSGGTARGSRSVRLSRSGSAWKFVALRERARAFSPSEQRCDRSNRQTRQIARVHGPSGRAEGGRPFGLRGSFTLLSRAPVSECATFARCCGPSGVPIPRENHRSRRIARIRDDPRTCGISGRTVQVGFLEPFSRDLRSVCGPRNRPDPDRLGKIPYRPANPLSAPRAPRVPAPYRQRQR